MTARVANTRPIFRKNQTESSFCQPQTVGYRASGQPSADWNRKKLFCFYDIQDDFRPQDLNPCLCTHVVYSYVAVRKNLSFIAGKKGKFNWKTTKTLLIDNVGRCCFEATASCRRRQVIWPAVKRFFRFARRAPVAFAAFRLLSFKTTSE